MRKVLGSGTSQARRRPLAETAYLPSATHPASVWIAVATPLAATLILVGARLLGL